MGQADRIDGEVSALTEMRIALALGRPDFFCGVTSAGERRARLIDVVATDQLADSVWRDGETFGELILRLYTDVEPEVATPATGQVDLF